MVKLAKITQTPSPATRKQGDSRSSPSANYPRSLARRPSAGAELELDRQELHYLTRVLRLRPGDRFAVVDGAGSLWTALLGPADQALLEQPPAPPGV